MKLSNRAPVVVTGAGIVSSVGEGISTFLNALRYSKSCFRRSSHFPSLSFPFIIADLETFSFEKSLRRFSGIPSSILARAKKAGLRSSLAVQTALIAALEAWEAARLSERQINHARVGLVIAGHNLSQGYQFPLQAIFQNEPSYLPPTYALRFMDTDQVGSLSEVFGILGEGFTVGGASASGNMGLIHGQRLIDQGLVDICMVIGSLAELSPMEIQGFHAIGALGGQRFAEPSQSCRPFDCDRDGFILGQACGCMILESAESSDYIGKDCLGLILGSAIVLDGHRSTEPNMKGECTAMQKALDNAQLCVEDIQYINTHGSASILGDDTEIAAIESLLGESSSKVHLNSTKGLVGHCLWSAGLVEGIATLLQLKNGFLHGNLNLVNPIKTGCKFVGGESVTMVLDKALSNSFGFGGINTSIAFSKANVQS